MLEAFGITLPAQQLAGGVVVAHSGFAMITATPRLTADERGHAQRQTGVSFPPMAVPLIAGPGALGVVIALASRHPGSRTARGSPPGRCSSARGSPRPGAGGAARAPHGAHRRGRGHPIMGFLILAIGAELIVHGVRAATA